jgi:predicted metalloprotease with PDZ domain
MRKLGIAFLLFISTRLHSQLQYIITYKDSTKPVIVVQIKPSQPITSPVSFVMPRSVPGSYSILKYDLFIEHLQGADISGKKVAFVKNLNDAPRWSIADTGIQFTEISYEVNPDKMERRLFSSGDASIIRKGFAGLLNYSIVGFIDGTEWQPVTCRFETFDSWPIFSTLAPSTNMQKGKMECTTDNYFKLADAQTFMGTAFQVKTYNALAPLFVVSYSETQPQYLDDYGWQETRSMEILKDYFGELPFKHYSLMLRSAIALNSEQQSSLAMEHLESSTFFGDTSYIRMNPMDENEKWNTLPTYLHHMSHAYIPLHCYGDAYRPYVMEIPPVINNIWFNEGFMWYIVYDTLKLDRMMRNFNNNVYYASPVIKRMSLEQLSETASTQYGDDFRLGKAVYSRGALMAKEINEFVKEKTAGKRSMKDIYRYLYEWSKQNNRAFTMEEFPKLLEAATGVDVSAIYNKWQLPIDK